MSRGIPNLDDCSATDLVSAHQAFADLTSFADLAIRARKLRLDGDILGARGLEKKADKLYDRLPDWAKW